MATSQDGPLLVRGLGLQLPRFDYVSNAPTDTTDVYTLRVGGASGAVVCTLTLVFTDDTKSTLSTMTRVPQLPFNS